MSIFQNHVESGPGLLEEYCEIQGWSASCVQTWHDLPGSGYPKADVYVFLGSLHSVNEENSQIVSGQKKIITELIQKGCPLFGICFGAQLIASVIGGIVKPLQQRCDGWSKNSQAIDDVWSGPWFKWHEERITLPGEVEVLASDSDIVQAYKHRKTIGVQFHPEISADVLRQWIQHEYFEEEHTKALLENFIRYADQNDKQIRRNAFELFDSAFGYLMPTSKVLSRFDAKASQK